VDEERASALQVTEEQPDQSDPSSSLKGHGEKTARTLAHTTQGTESNPPSEVEQDSTETASHDNAEVIPERAILPERQARERFTSLLAQIAEEPEFSEADRSIGNYQFQDEEWDSWTRSAGQVEREDEFDEDTESESESDEPEVTRTTTVKGRAASKPPSRSGALPKPNSNKSKVAGKSKRKHKDLVTDSDSASDSEQRECPYMETL
jgi:hypothetical protein